MLFLPPHPLLRCIRVTDIVVRSTDIVNGSMNVNGSTMLKMMLLRRVVQTFRCSGFDVMGKTKNKCSSLRQTLMYINARLVSVSISASLRLFMVCGVICLTLLS